MRNIAIFNIDSHASALAIQELLLKHRNEIKLLVLSRPIASQKQNFFLQVLQHWKKSGFSYVYYLSANFLLHPFLCRISELYGKAIGKKPYIRSLDSLCKELGIRCVRTSNINGEDICHLLREHKIDLVTVYYFDQILKKRLLSILPERVINFHAAMLPHCRGLHPIIWSAIQNQPFGMSSHLIPDARIDAGPLLGQQPIMSSGENHVLSIEQAINQKGTKLYTKVINNFEEIKTQAIAQTEGSYFSHPTRSDLLRLKRQGFHLIKTKLWLKNYFRTQDQNSDQFPERCKNVVLSSTPPETTCTDV